MRQTSHDESRPDRQRALDQAKPLPYWLISWFFAALIPRQARPANEHGRNQADGLLTTYLARYVRATALGRRPESGLYPRGVGATARAASLRGLAGL